MPIAALLLDWPTREDKAPVIGRYLFGLSFVKVTPWRQTAHPISHPRAANLHGPQTLCKTSLLAVAISVPELFLRIISALAFLSPTIPSLPAPTDLASILGSLPEQTPPPHRRNFPLIHLPQQVFIFIGVSFLCRLQQAAFRFKVHERVRLPIFYVHNF